MDKFATAYHEARANAFREYDVEALREEIAKVKDAALPRLDELVRRFKAKAEATGVHVHLAGTATRPTKSSPASPGTTSVKKIVKSKSMTAEETLLNHHLEDDGLEVMETDLGEWIIQLRHEGPSHMVMPAIHLSRYQVAELFTQVTQQDQASDIERPGQGGPS